MGKLGFVILIIIFVVLTILMLILYIKKQKDYRKLMSKMLHRENKPMPILEITNFDKYFVNQIDENDKKILQDIKYLFEKDKIYLNSDLSIGMLAKKLGTNKNTISRVINAYLEKSFPSLLGEYRVQEAIEIMSNSSMDFYTIDAIGGMCGFKNRQVFYRVFKKVTGVTPNYYRQVVHVNDAKSDENK